MHTVSAHDVAAYIVQWFNGKEEESDLTPMKLQKLLYYCQGYTLAVTGLPLFNDVIEAWEHGPVVADVYKAYSSQGNVPVTTPITGKGDALTSEQQDLCSEVLTVRGQFSAWMLRESTHREAPWVNTFVANQNNTIPVEVMKAYFEDWVVSEAV